MCFKPLIYSNILKNRSLQLCTNLSTIFSNLDKGYTPSVNQPLVTQELYQNILLCKESFPEPIGLLEEDEDGHDILWYFLKGVSTLIIGYFKGRKFCETEKSRNSAYLSFSILEKSLLFCNANKLFQEKNFRDFF